MKITLFEPWFKERIPSGDWEVTLESCIEHSGHFPWGWLAENILSPIGKIRYNRHVLEARMAYTMGREPMLIYCRNHGGIADPSDIPKLRQLEAALLHHEARAFYKAQEREDAL